MVLRGDSVWESLSTSESEHEVESGLLLDVVIAESATILKLFACEDQSLLIGRDALLILDLGLHILDGVSGLHVEGDGLAGQGLHEDLHASTKSENQVQGRLFLDVVVAQGSSVLKLLSSKD